MLMPLFKQVRLSLSVAKSVKVGQQGLVTDRI